jgi:hypothetical protein
MKTSSVKATPSQQIELLCKQISNSYNIATNRVVMLTDLPDLLVRWTDDPAGRAILRSP